MKTKNTPAGNLSESDSLGDSRFEDLNGSGNIFKPAKHNAKKERLKREAEHKAAA